MFYNCGCSREGPYLSTTGAEISASVYGAKDGKYLCNLAGQFTHVQKPIPIFIDNQSAVKWTERPKFHARTKHLSIRLYYLRDLVLRGEFKAVHIAGTKNFADMLTKGQQIDLFRKHASVVVDGEILEEEDDDVH